MWWVAYHVFAGQSAQYDVATVVPPVVIGCVPEMGIVAWRVKRLNVTDGDKSLPPAASN